MLDFVAVGVQLPARHKHQEVKAPSAGEVDDAFGTLWKGAVEGVQDSRLRLKYPQWAIFSNSQPVASYRYLCSPSMHTI